MSSISLSDIRSFLQEAADEYTDARKQLRVAGCRLEAKRRNLQEALQRFYQKTTGRSLTIRAPSRRKSHTGAAPEL